MERKRLTSEEKEALWEQIERGVELRRRRAPHRFSTDRLPFWLGVAAALAILGAVAVTLILNRQAPSSLDEMRTVARLADTVTSDQVQVLAVNPDGQVEDPGQPAYRTVIVPYGEQTVVDLPDSTRIWLNSGSTLVYPEVFSRQQRQVYLEGEAYFDVRHNERRPFFVQLKDMEIKVLGTEFNVSAYVDDQSSHVMLVAGSVELRLSGSPSGETVKTRLIPHEMAVYRAGNRKLEVSAAPVEEYVTWRTGSMVFKNTPLEIILKKLQRYYRVQIRLEEAELAAATFSGPLDLKRDIEEVLDIICLTTALEYEIKEGVIILKGTK